MTRLALGVAMCLLLALAASSAGAETSTSTPSESSPAVVFWAQSPRGREQEPGTIGRAELNGSGAQGSFIAGVTAPGGVAISGDYVYWANYGAGTIGRANVDGAELDQQFIKGVEAPIGVAIGDGHIYWSNAFVGIGRANLNGSEVDQHFIRTQGEVTGIAVDRQYVYWTLSYPTHDYLAKGYAIGRASLNGTGVDERFINLANNADGVAVNSRYIFWTDVGEHAIGRANLEGAAVSQRCIAVNGVPLENVPEGLAVNGQDVYWTNYPADSIARANFEGSEVNERFLEVDGVPEGIAVGRTSEPESMSSAEPCRNSQEEAHGLQTAPLLLGPRGQLAGPSEEGWGEVAPAVISNGGHSPSGTISDIHWTSWGGKVAVGRGLNPECGDCKRVAIDLRASVIRRCRRGGRLVYARFSTREPEKGGPLGKWGAWAPNMCTGERT